MSLEYSRSALRICVAQICQNLGWNSIHSTPLELLTDILERYLFQLSKLSHRYAEQFGLTDPRLEDVGLALGHMGVSLHELEEYIKHVDPLEFAKEVVAFPVPRQNDLKFPNPESKEVQQRKVFEFVPEHLPYMHPELNEDTEDLNPPLAASPERLQVEQQPQTAELSPSQGEKRPISSPGDSNLPFKRPRLTTLHLPDEASHSQYEMTSVVMTNSGILSPMRQGKIPDSRTPPGATQIVIVKSASSGAHKGPVGAAMPGVNLNPETPIITLDFSKDPVSGQSKSAEGDGEIESGTQVNFDKSDPEFHPKKKSKEKGKLPKAFKIKRGPGRPRSPGRAPVVIHKKSEMDIYKMLTLPRKDDSLGKIDTLDQQGPIDLTVKPTPAPPNISVKLDESLRAKSVEYKQKNVTISKEQEQDMEETIASVIKRSAQFDMDTVDRSSYQLPMIHKESDIHDRNNMKTETDLKQEAVWRVSSISETYTDENAHDSFEDDGRNMGFLSPPQHFFTAPHLKFLQQSSPRRRGRPRGSSSAIYRGLTGRGRKPGRPPLNKSPARGSPGRPPLNRSPGRPPLNRSPGRPPGSGRSPGRPKGSLNKVHSPKPRGRPRGSKSPRSRGSSPRGVSPRGAIQNINFDVNTITDIPKPCKEDSNDSEATNFEFPTQSPDSDLDKKSFDMEEGDKKHFDLTDSQKSPKKRDSPAVSPIHSPSKHLEEISPSRSTVANLSMRKEVTPDTKSAKIDPFSLKREPSSDLSDKDLKEKLQDSEDDSSRKTTNYGELDSQSRNSEDRDSSSERMFTSKHKWRKEKSLDRERRDSSVELDLRDSSAERERRTKSKDRDYDKDKENIMEEKIFKKERSREMSIGRDLGEPTVSRNFKEHSRDRDLRENSRDRDEREMSWDRESREISKERDYSKLEVEHREHSKDRERREHSKEHVHKEHSKDRGHKEHSKDREHKEHSKDREHKEKSKEREHKEKSKEREHKEHSKEREHKEHKEHSKDREHKEHRKDKDHKKDKKKKKKKDKEKDKERDEKKEKKEKHKVKEKDNREESPSIQPLVQKLKIKFGGGSATSPGSFSVSASTTPASPVRESVSPVQRPEIPKLKFKVLPPKPDASSGLSKDSTVDVQSQSWTSSVKQEIERVPTPKHEPRDPSPAYSPAKVKSEPVDEPGEDNESKEKDGSDDDLNKSADNETEKEVTVSVIKGKITGIGSAKKPGKRGKRKGSMKKGKPKTPKLITQLESSNIDTKILPLKKGLDKDSSESPSNLFSGENVPSPITIPALKAAPPPPSPPVTKKTPPKPKPLLKEKEMKPPSPLLKEVVPKVKPSPVTLPKPAKVSKSPRRSSPRKPQTVKKKGAVISTPTSKSPSPKPPSPAKSTTFDFTVPRTPSPSPLSTPSHSVHSSPMYSPASSPSRDSLTFNIPPTPAFPTRTTSPPLSPPSRQLSTDDEKEATPPVEKPRMPAPALPPMPPTSAMRRQQRSVVAETIGSFVNESGEKIWICPTCTMQDDGSPMVGCDICDDWYHWICVGIKAEPEEEVWYCPKCKPTKTQQKKRGRKKKK